MKDFFNNLSEKTFEYCFPDEESCLKFLAEQKWKDGFICRKCGNDNYCKGKTNYSRRCTRCKHEESATSHTIFHNCRISLKKAFLIALMVCHEPEISTYKISRKIDIRQMTCWKFKKKLLECIEKKMNISDFDTLLDSRKN